MEPEAQLTEKLPEQPKQEAKAQQSSISLGKNRDLAPKNNAELLRVLKVIKDGGGMPERFDTQAKQVAAYNLSSALMGPKWQLAMNNIAIIKGQMSIYGELPSALAEQTGEVQEKDLYCVDKELKKMCLANKNVNVEPYAGVCNIQRKGRKIKEFVYTVDDALRAGQLPAMKWSKKEGRQVPNDDSPWVKHLRTMLMRKAMALAVKFEFADAVMGVPISEYDFDVIPDGSLKDVTPVNEAAEEINREYKDEEAKPETEKV